MAKESGEWQAASSPTLSTDHVRPNSELVLLEVGTQMTPLIDRLPTGVKVLSVAPQDARRPWRMQLRYGGRQDSNAVQANPESPEEA